MNAFHTVVSGVTVLRRWLVIALCIVATASLTANAGAVEIQRVISPGKIEAWLVRDTSVPIVTISFTFEAGGVYDPDGKEGLAELASGLLDEGAGPLDSKSFQQELEDNSITLRYDAGNDRFSGRLRTLAIHRDRAFELLRLSLTAPRFDPEPVERIRGQILAGLRQSLQNPQTIAGRTWMKMVYPHHPYGRPVGGTLESLPRITIADLKAFAAKRLGRDRLTIGVVGDITADELAGRLDRIFGGLPAKAELPPVPEAVAKNAGMVKVVKKSIPQSIVLFGHQGIKRDDPDWYTAYVMNSILGGSGFSSRLTEEVREKRGLAYFVYSSLDPNDHGGLIAGGTATRNSQVARSLAVIRAEWKRMAEHGVTAEELANAKTYINGSFPLTLSSGGRIARLLVGMQISHLGIDYLDRRPQLMNAVTQADVSRVARRLLKPEGLTVVVVGDPKGIEDTAAANP